MLIPYVLDNFLSEMVTVVLENTCPSAMMLKAVCDMCLKYLLVSHISKNAA